MGNKGAFIRFKAPDLKPDIVTFSAVVSVHFSNHHVYGLFYVDLPFLRSLHFVMHCDIAATSRCKANGIRKQLPSDVPIGGQSIHVEHTRGNWRRDLASCLAICRSRCDCLWMLLLLPNAF